MEGMKRFLLTFSVMVLLSACDVTPYGVAGEGENQHVINKWTGTSYSISDRSMVELAVVSRDEWALITTPKTMESQSPAKHKFDVSVRLRFIENEVSYQVALRPKRPSGSDEEMAGSTGSWDSDIVVHKGNFGSVITVALLDDHGFEIAELSLPLRGFTKIVFEGEEAMMYEVKGTVQMSLSTYQRVDGWSLGWNF